jgi:hypothetical protein
MKAVALIACGCVLGACAGQGTSGGTREENPTASVPAERRLGRLDVLVRDRQDRPIAEARVGEIQSDDRRFWEVPVPAGAAPGVYRLDEHAPGTIRVCVRARGFAPTVATAHIGADDAREISVRLAPAASIRGVVLDDRGFSVEGATVSACSEDESGLNLVDAIDEKLPIVTALDGAFEIPDLAEGPYSVGAWNDDAYMQGEPPVVRAPAEDVVLRVVRCGEIRFYLRVPPGGPVPETVVSEHCESNWHGGVFTEERLPPGPGRLRLFARGYCALTLDYVVEPATRTDLGEFVLDEGVVLRGRVTDPSGEAVAGASVDLMLDVLARDPRVVTDDRGAFEMPHADRGANRLRVERDGFVRGEYAVSGDAATASSTLVLLHGGVLRLRVVDAAGLPAPSVRFFMTDSGGGIVYGDRDSITDDRGMCEIRLAEGKYRVTAGGDESPTTFAVSEGGTSDVTLMKR